MEITSSYLKNLPNLNRQAHQNTNPTGQQAKLSTTDNHSSAIDKLSTSLLNRSDAELQKEFASQNKVTIMVVEYRSPSEFLAIDGQIRDNLATFKDDYERAHADLARRNPALAAKDFGFTLNPQGELTVLERESHLSQQEIDYLNNWLNDSGQLKEHARQAAQLMIQYTNVAPSITTHPGQTTEMHLNGQEKFRPPGRYNLNMENFHNTIDLEQALDLNKNIWTLDTPPTLFAGQWIDQLYSKGELRPIEEIIRVNPGFSAKA